MGKLNSALISILFVFSGSVWGQSDITPAYEAPSARSVYVHEKPPQWTYDVGAAAGTDQLGTYTEIQGGVNWYANQWLSWRNALFTRFGASYDTMYGLDSSIRGEVNLLGPKSRFGLQGYAGPGVQIANLNSNAGFLELGLTFKIAGLYIGGGVKQMYYAQNRTDRDGDFLGKEETQTYLALSAGGRF